MEKIQSNNSLKQGTLLIGCILLTNAAGFIGSFFTTPQIPNWYADLNKPVFNPPNWVFAPVWTTLFILMGISLFLVIRQGIKKPLIRSAVVVFGFQLMLNILWSVLFFGLQNPLAAVCEIVVLIIAIIWTMLLFYRLSKPAAYLLIPYLAWVSFASVLNFTIWWLN